MCATFQPKVLLMAAAVLLLHSSALASPVTQFKNIKDVPLKERNEEVSDLNVSAADLSSKEPLEQTEKKTVKEGAFTHRDEDQQRTEVDLSFEKNLKYDVEILESRDIKKENIEIEERFRGPAMEINTDLFAAENIEMNEGSAAVQESHMILTIILVLIALVSIGLYAALVIWRSHLEQRYGMRELLVTSDDDFYPQQCNVSDSDSNARQLRVVHQT